jgi:hypothetical protein
MLELEEEALPVDMGMNMKGKGLYNLNFFIHLLSASGLGSAFGSMMGGGGAHMPPGVGTFNPYAAYESG